MTRDFVRPEPKYRLQTSVIRHPSSVIGPRSSVLRLWVISFQISTPRPRFQIPGFQIYFWPITAYPLPLTICVLLSCGVRSCGLQRCGLRGMASVLRPPSSVLG